MTKRKRVRTAVCEMNLLESLYQDFSRESARLLAEPQVTEGWARVRAILAAMPLTTGEYATAVNRLASAELYTARRELGAAKFELTQLARKLASLGTLCGARAELSASDLPGESAVNS
ncbi:MAG: hypothetical protein ABSG53_07490 [Thermoguttaceae bacterium]|jgi:hypothetical protein